MRTVLYVAKLVAVAMVITTAQSFTLGASTNGTVHNDGILLLSLHQDTVTFTDICAPLVGGFFSSIVWGDYDNDGDLDLLVNGQPDEGNPYTKVYRNDNGLFVDIQAPLVGVQSAHSESWVDFDNDGDLDIMIQGATGWYNYQPVSTIYRNDSGNFVDIHANLTGVVYGSTSWGDFDNDGDLDLLLTGSPDGGNTFISKIYRNDDSVFTDIHAGLPGVWGSSAAWGDYDNDGDLDIALSGYGDWGVTSRIFRNDDGVFTDINAAIVAVDHSSLAWGDVDNDGDLDLLISGLASGGIVVTTVYRNDNGIFINMDPDLPPVMTGAVAWGDYDGDGRLDIVISGSMTYHEGFQKNDPKQMMIYFYKGIDGYVTDPVTKLFHNDLHADSTIGFSEVTQLPGLHNAAVAFGDYDNDGDLDIAISGGTSYSTQSTPFYPITRIYRNNHGTNTFARNARPTVPQNLQVQTVGAITRLSWNRATDDHTPQGSLMYNFRLGTSQNSTDVISPYANPTTGYQRIPKMANANNDNQWIVRGLPDGTYYWSVQAVDGAYAGSAFATEQQFMVGNSVIVPPSKWRMVSVANQHIDMHKTTLYPSAVSRAFGYDPSIGSYTSEDILKNGAGYWMKFPSTAAHIPLGGASVTERAIMVQPGWNMIGSITSSVQVATIISDPPGLVTSQFFRYNSRYSTTDVITPGEGYWVKVHQSGILTLIASLNGEELGSAIRIVPNTQDTPPLPPDESFLSVVPTEFALRQNYPNPFNPSTNIKYEVPTTKHVSLKVYDVLGRELATLVNEVHQPGEYSVQWDAANIPSGIYFARMIAGSFRAVNKMMLIK